MISSKKLQDLVETYVGTRSISDREHLVKESQPYLATYTQRFARGESDHDDLISEANIGLLRLLTHLEDGKYRGKARFTTLLFVTCKNASYEFGRRRSRDRMRYLPEINEDLHPIVESSQINSSDAKDLVKKMMSKLTPKVRKFAEAYFIDEYTSIEAAKIAGFINDNMPTSTKKSRAHLAVVKVRKLFCSDPLIRKKYSELMESK